MIITDEQKGQRRECVSCANDNGDGQGCQNKGMFQDDVCPCYRKPMEQQDIVQSSNMLVKTIQTMMILAGFAVGWVIVLVIAKIGARLL